MSKLFLVVFCALLAFVPPSLAASSSTSDSKVAKAGKKVRTAVMWGPKKVGHGLKTMGEKTKSALHHNKTKK